jgi:Tol biopolymer transport system component
MKHSPHLLSFFVLAGIVLLALTGCGGGGGSDPVPTPSPISVPNPTPPPKNLNSKITFVSERDGGKGEIYVMDADGSNQKRLTNNAVEEVYPAFSSDGSKIAFVSARDGNYEIYVMDTDGSNQKRLTNNDAIDTLPAFSPDGKK